MVQNSKYKTFFEELDADHLYELREHLTGAGLEGTPMEDSIDGIVGYCKIDGTVNGGSILNQDSNKRIVFNGRDYPVLITILDEVLTKRCGGTDYDSYQRYMDAINED